MTSKLYWTAVAVLVAVVVHLSYVLLVPRLEMRGKIEDVQRVAGSGALTVLDADQSVRFIGPEGRWLVHALCIYDLRQGPVMVTAAVPSTYWSMSMYSSRGDSFYSLNDRQAGIARVAVLLKPRKTELIGDLLEETEAPQGEVIAVEAPDAAGLVVMRALAAEPAEYSRISSVMAQSGCRILGS
jgi:uncharacterized membrane protein